MYPSGSDKVEPRGGRAVACDPLPRSQVKLYIHPKVVLGEQLWKSSVPRSVLIRQERGVKPSPLHK